MVDGSGSIDEGYAGNGFPEPGYYITLPNSLNELVGGADDAFDLSEQLTLRYDDHSGVTREWVLALYGTAKNSTDVEAGGETRARYIYKLLPAAGQQLPVRVQIRDQETGQAVLSDDFTPSVEEKYKEYDMTIYSGALDQNFVSAELVVGSDAYVCPVSVQPGKLTVRGLNDGMTTGIVTGDAAVPGGITASAPDDVTYFVNDSRVEVAEPEHVKLLVDSVLDENILTDYIAANLTDESPGYEVGYQQQYMDLVDAQNGNAFLTMGSGQQMTIYWPVPGDYVAGGAVNVYHFEALDRNYDVPVEEMLENAPPRTIVPTLTTIGGQDYFAFETGSFSPFVLAYEKTPAIYALTVENGSGSGQYKAGTQVAITADAAPAGKVFDRWVTSGGGSFVNASSAATSFTMPAGDVTVTALYKNAPSGGGSNGGSSGGSGSPAGPAQPAGPAAGPLPQTGDAGAPLLWLALLAASGAGLLAVFALKRRDRG